MKKVGFLALLDPENRLNFSGTLYYMLQSLRSNKHLEVTVIADEFFEGQRTQSKLNKLIRGICRRSAVLDRAYTKTVERKLAKVMNRDIKANSFDFVVAPVASRAIATFLEHPIASPIIFITDATPKFIEDYYGWTVDKNAHQNETYAIQKSALVIYSSQFMADLAIKDYVDFFGNAKPKAISFGLNMDKAPSKVITKSNDQVNLLFVGRFWERKGGDIALECIRILIAKGVSAKLTIVGCTPPESINDPSIKVIPFIDKNIPSQQAKYFELLSKAHYLILPTRADCTPMVIAEANAFSAPVLTTNVGGIPSLVEDNVNGFLFDLEANAERYAEKILEVRQSGTENYTRLSEQSFHHYCDKLNWQAWAEQISKLMDKTHISPS